MSRRDWLLLAVTAVAFAAFTPLHAWIGWLGGCTGYAAPDMNWKLRPEAYVAAKKCLMGNGAALDAYIEWHTFRLDLLFPALLAFTLTVILLRIGGRLPRFKAMSQSTQHLSAATLPLAYALADYAENWHVYRWLKSGDDGLLPLIQALTALKFAALAVTVVVAVSLLLAGLKGKGRT